jgi:hypothetical protein
MDGLEGKFDGGSAARGVLAACGPTMRLIMTIARAEEVRRAKSRFTRPVILRVFPHNPSTPAVAFAQIPVVRQWLGEMADSTQMGRSRRCSDNPSPL